MSQQGFQSQEPDEAGNSSYGEAQWSAKKRNVPKNEHPSNYSEVPPRDGNQVNYQSGYRSQDSAEYAQQSDRSEKNRTGRTRTQKEDTTHKKPFQADGDAFESSYRPFGQSSRQKRPWYLFRQRTYNFKWWQWIIITICAIILFALIIQLVFYLISVAIALLFILFAILIILRALGFPVFRSRSRPWVNGPWRWWR